MPTILLAKSSIISFFQLSENFVVVLWLLKILKLKKEMNDESE